MSTEQQRTARQDAGRPTAETWVIPRRVWFVLMSWGLSVLVLAGLLSFWIWSNQRQQDAKAAAALKAQQGQAAALKLEQDRAMCAMLQLFTTGPAPVEGPAGDRGRVILRAMTNYQATLGCSDLLPKLPTAPR